MSSPIASASIVIARQPSPYLEGEVLDRRAGLTYLAEGKGVGYGTKSVGDSSFSNSVAVSGEWVASVYTWRRYTFLSRVLSGIGYHTF